MIMIILSPKTKVPGDEAQYLISLPYKKNCSVSAILRMRKKYCTPDKYHCKMLKQLMVYMISMVSRSFLQLPRYVCAF